MAEFDLSRNSNMLLKTLADRQTAALQGRDALQQQAAKAMMNEASLKSNEAITSANNQNAFDRQALNQGYMTSNAAKQFPNVTGTANATSKMDTQRIVENFMKTGQGANALAGAGIFMPQGTVTTPQQIPTQSFVQGEPKAVQQAKAAVEIAGKQGAGNEQKFNTIMVPDGKGGMKELTLPIKENKVTNTSEISGSQKNTPQAGALSQELINQVFNAFQTGTYSGGELAPQGMQPPTVEAINQTLTDILAGGYSPTGKIKMVNGRPAIQVVDARGNPINAIIGAQ